MSGAAQSRQGPETPEQALTRAQAAAQARRFGEAAGICSDVLAAVPEHPSALALLGIVHAHQGHIEHAIGMLERAVERQAGVAAWYANLCSLYRITNRMQEALTAGRESVRLAPDSADNLVNLSLVLSDLDERKRAIACLLRALGLNNSHADAHLAMAQNLLAQGELDPGWIEYRMAESDRSGTRATAADHVRPLDRNVHSWREDSAGRRSRIWRYHPIRALYPNGGSALR